MLNPLIVDSFRTMKRLLNEGTQYNVKDILMQYRVLPFGPINLKVTSYFPLDKKCTPGGSGGSAIGMNRSKVVILRTGHLQGRS